MLTCEICGEEIMLEEDMKTHLLLSHLENDMHCPLCSLSGVSYNELYFHIGSAHPEKQQGVQGPGHHDDVSKTPQTGPELLFQFSLAGDSCDMAGETTTTGVCSTTIDSVPQKQKVSPGTDLRVARQLHQEEEQIRKQEEAQQEREEFKKLQRQFGLDDRGGYCRQMERTMERAVARGLMTPSEFHYKRAEMMESLASGFDDGRTRTQGVVRALHEYYQTECRDCVHVWLSADTDHYCSSAGDKGWGCGYRNFQMLLSSLHRIETYAPFLQEKAMPSIPQVQSMIEEAWKEGLDPQGASHFNKRLQGTRAWIGSTEIFILLTSMGISARIIDFHQPTGPGDTHPWLFDWVKQYFFQSSRSSKLPPRLIHTSLPPLYLQHQGHSRCIVGMEQKKNGSLCLLLLDPGSSVSDTRKLLSGDTISTAIRHVRKFPASLKHKQYQVVAIQGVLSAEEKQITISNSKILCAERIP
ncbi:hypothetical protein L3Q82_002555 [Scortum barcoo]|uniref:Uncharacterized protein n=1 Tax=Scortum barcoo TaxID=214431 RepID=A0ACB8VZ30_9TELE|nr:hypothetical protein L3Q82_002555 [Scortum barcoo]